MRPGKLLKIHTRRKVCFYPIIKKISEIIKEEQAGDIFRPKFLTSKHLFLLVSTNPGKESEIKKYVNFFDLHNPWLILAIDKNENCVRGLIEVESNWFYEIIS